MTAAGDCPACCPARAREPLAGPGRGGRAARRRGLAGRRPSSRRRPGVFNATATTITVLAQLDRWLPGHGLIRRLVPDRSQRFLGDYPAQPANPNPIIDGWWSPVSIYPAPPLPFPAFAQDKSPAAACWLVVALAALSDPGLSEASRMVTAAASDCSMLSFALAPSSSGHRASCSCRRRP